MFLIQLFFVAVGAGLVAFWRLVLHSGIAFGWKLPIYVVLVIALIVPLLALDAIISSPFQRYESPQFTIGGQGPLKHRAVVFLAGMVNGAEITSRDYRQQFADSYGPTVYADYPRYGFNMDDYVSRLHAFLVKHGISEVRIVAPSFGMDVAVAFIRYNRVQDKGVSINGVISVDGMTCAGDVLSGFRPVLQAARVVDGGWLTTFILSSGFKLMAGSGHGTHDQQVSTKRLVEHENYMFGFPSRGLTGQARAILNAPCPKPQEFAGIPLVDFRCTGEDDRVDKAAARFRLQVAFPIGRFLDGGVVHAGLVGEPTGWTARFNQAFAYFDVQAKLGR